MKSLSSGITGHRTQLSLSRVFKRAPQEKIMAETPAMASWTRNFNTTTQPLLYEIPEQCWHFTCDARKFDRLLY